MSEALPLYEAIKRMTATRGPGHAATQKARGQLLDRGEPLDPPEAARIITGRGQGTRAIAGFRLSDDHSTIPHCSDFRHNGRMNPPKDLGRRDEARAVPDDGASKIR
jgi:hypothetical protein